MLLLWKKVLFLPRQQFFLPNNQKKIPFVSLLLKHFARKDGENDGNSKKSIQFLWHKSNNNSSEYERNNKTVNKKSKAIVCVCEKLFCQKIKVFYSFFRFSSCSLFFICCYTLFMCLNMIFIRILIFLFLNPKK